MRLISYVSKSQLCVFRSIHPEIVSLVAICIWTLMLSIVQYYGVNSPDHVRLSLLIITFFVLSGYLFMASKPIQSVLINKEGFHIQRPLGRISVIRWHEIKSLLIESSNIHMGVFWVNPKEDNKYLRKRLGTIPSIVVLATLPFSSSDANIAKSFIEALLPDIEEEFTKEFELTQKGEFRFEILSCPDGAQEGCLRPD